MQTQEDDILNKIRLLLPTLKVDKIERLDKGLSNDNFLVLCCQGKYVLKCYRKMPSTSLLDTQQCLAQQGITQRLIAYDKQACIAILEFIDEVKPFAKFETDIVAKLIKVHQYDAKSAPRLNVKALLQQLDMKRFGFATQAQQWALSTMDALPEEIAFCHNDLVLDNIINSHTGAKLIDFEYARNNDIYFDLAALACSYNLDANDTQFLIATYYSLRQSCIPWYANKKLLAYQLAYILLCIDWYDARGAMSYITPLIDRFVRLDPT